MPSSRSLKVEGSERNRNREMAAWKDSSQDAGLEDGRRALSQGLPAHVREEKAPGSPLEPPEGMQLG